MKIKRFPRWLVFLSVTLVISVIGCFLMGVVIYHLLGYGCYWWECAPKRSFTVFDVALPARLLPAGSEELTLYPDRGTVGATEEAHGVSTGIAICGVMRFATIEKASRYYEARTANNLFTAPLDDRSPFSQVLEYRSKIADQYSTDCGYVIASPRCIFSARYQEYYVYFSGLMGDGKMTPTAFVMVPEYLDTRMQELLSQH